MTQRSRQNRTTVRFCAEAVTTPSDITLAGASRLAAGATAVVMISEVLFASGSAVLLGAGVVTVPLLAGAALILGAALLATR